MRISTTPSTAVALTLKLPCSWIAYIHLLMQGIVGRGAERYEGVFDLSSGSSTLLDSTNLAVTQLLLQGGVDFMGSLGYMGSR